MEWEAQCPKPTYLESLLDEKADDIGRTTGEQREDAIRNYGALEFRLELVNAHEGRLDRQRLHAMAELQKKLDEFYKMEMSSDIPAMVGRILASAKTLGRIEGQKTFLKNYVDASPEIAE